MKNEQSIPPVSVALYCKRKVTKDADEEKRVRD